MFVFSGETPAGLFVTQKTIIRCETVGLSGPSGSGKSRLMRALADLDPSDMELVFDGRPCEQVSPHTWRKNILYCAASPAWWPDDTLASVFPSDRERACFAPLGLSDLPLDRPLRTFSTGEQQRAHVARYILLARDVLLLDEPTSALDEEAASVVEDMIRHIGRRVAVLLTSHDKQLLARLASRHWVIANGQLDEHIS